MFKRFMVSLAAVLLICSVVLANGDQKKSRCRTQPCSYKRCCNDNQPKCPPKCTVDRCDKDHKACKPPAVKYDCKVHPKKSRWWKFDWFKRFRGRPDNNDVPG